MCWRSVDDFPRESWFVLVLLCEFGFSGHVFIKSYLVLTAVRWHYQVAVRACVCVEINDFQTKTTKRRATKSEDSADTISQAVCRMQTFGVVLRIVC